MPVTNLRARWMVDAPKTRTKILKALRACGGNAHMAAGELECSYTTLWRLISEDSILRRKVKALRNRLAKEGYSQKGWPGLK